MNHSYYGWGGALSVAGIITTFAGAQTPQPPDGPATTGGPSNMGVFGDQIEANKPMPPVEYMEVVLKTDTASGWQVERNPKLREEVLTVRLYSRSGRITAGYAQTSLSPMPKKLHVTQLSREGRRIRGPIQHLIYVGENAVPQRGAPYELDVEVQGQSVTGKFESVSGPGDQKIPYGCKLVGSVTGRVIPESELTTPARTLAKGADWPCWRGPNGNGTVAAAAEPKLIRNWNDARFVWRSESHVWGLMGEWVLQAHNSPIVGDNLVFVHNTEANLEGPMDNNPMLLGKLQPKWGIPHTIMERTGSACFFDDVVWAIDARTGATVWKRRWLQTGLNDAGKNKRGLFSSPIYDNGRLFIQGLMGKLYCLNARTGETVWESSTDPERTKEWAEQKAKYLAKQVDRGFLWHKSPGGQELQASHVMADGVLVCSKRLGGGLVGIDPANGKELWSIKTTVRTGYASPVRWTCQGKEYALTGNALIEPKTGRICWQSGGTYGAGPTANGEYMMCHNPFSVWRISSEKVTQVWGLPEPTAEQKAEWAKMANGNEGGTFGNVDWSSGVVTGNAFLMPARRGASWSVRLDTDGQWKAVRYDQKLARELTATGSAILSGDLVITPRESVGPSLLQWNAGSGEIKVVNLTMDTDNAMCTSPAIADGRIFSRCQDGVVCFDLRQSK